MRIEIETAGMLWIAGSLKEESKILEAIKKLAYQLGEEFNAAIDESDEGGIDLGLQYDSQFYTIKEVKELYSTIKKAA
tara:strand:+ start:147 stop:380 length:234 start_codon:yes stop_codon:yes gene_type:complete